MCSFVRLTLLPLIHQCGPISTVYTQKHNNSDYENYKNKNRRKLQRENLGFNDHALEMVIHSLIGDSCAKEYSLDEIKPAILKHSLRESEKYDIDPIIKKLKKVMNQR